MTVKTFCENFKYVFEIWIIKKKKIVREEIIIMWVN